jgi:hypothetical protein
VNLCNTNRLRVTVCDARKFDVAPGFGRYYSNDHNQGRETNWDWAFGHFWLHVKWRPYGKQPSSGDSSNG